jgi:hypothetical protein
MKDVFWSVKFFRALADLAGQRFGNQLLPESRDRPMTWQALGFDGQLALPSKPVTLTLFKSGVRSGLNYYTLLMRRLRSQ